MNSTNMILRRKWAVPTLLFVLTLICHGFLLLADYVITDGWWMLDWMTERNWVHLKYLTYTNGLFFVRFVSGVFFVFPDPNTAIKISTLIHLFVASLLVYYIFEKVKLFSTTENLFIAVVSLTIPAVRVFGNAYPLMMYFSMYVLFLACVLVALQSENKTGYFHIALRAVAIGGFFVSFTFGSLLVFYYGFLVFLFMYESRLSKFDVLGKGWVWILRRSDYILVPVIFWLWRRIFFPGIGSGVNYQQPTIDNISEIPSQLLNLIVYTIPEQVFGGASLLFSIPIVGVVVIVLSYLFSRLMSKVSHTALNRSSKKVSTIQLLMSAVFLMALAVFPYWAAGYGIGTDGFESRHAFLMPIPLALILLTFFRLVPGVFLDPKVRMGSCFVFVFMVLSFSAVHWKTYYDWQAISIKEKSVIHNLAKQKKIGRYQLIKVHDKFILNYSYEQWGRWSFVFKLVTGDYNRYAFGSYKYGNGYPYPNRDLVVELVIGDVADAPFRSQTEKRQILEGKQAVLTIKPGIFFQEFVELAKGHDLQPTLEFKIGKRQKLVLVAKYLYYRVVDRDKLGPFLESITNVDVHGVNDLFSKNQSS